VKTRNLVLSALCAPDISILLPDLLEISVDRGQTLYEAGWPVEHAYFPSSAVLSSVTVMRDGRCVETATIGHESMVGMMPSLTRSMSSARVFVQIAGRALRLPAARLRAQAEASAHLRMVLNRHILASIRQTEQSVACNALHGSTARLARWLLTTADRTGSDGFALTQDYMAIMVGVQRSTVSLVASGLRTAGLIRYARGAVAILDRGGLEARACECYGVVRDAYDHDEP
jgi:CRP-like cAMP-binding protein